MSDNQNISERDDHLALVDRMSANLEKMNSSPKSPQTPVNKVAKRSIHANPGNSMPRYNVPGQFHNGSPSNDTYMSSAQPQLAAPRQRPQSSYGLQTGNQQGFALDPQLRHPLGYNNTAGLSPSMRQTHQQSASAEWKPQHPFLNRLWQPNGQQQRPYGQIDPRTQQRSFTDPASSMSSAPLSGGFNNAQPNQSFPHNFQTNNQNNFHNRVHLSIHPPLMPRGPSDTNRTPRISSLPTTSSGGVVSAPPTSSNIPGPLAGQKRRLATTSPEPPSTAQVHLQNNDHPNGTTLSVPRPTFMTTTPLYLPGIQPHNPNTSATASTLRALAPAIQIERYDCDLHCRNKGTCVHYHFVLGARHTPDGLICKKCHEAGEVNLLPKAKRVCPFHYDAQVKGALMTLPCDYLATKDQRLRMVEIVERAWRNEWVGRVEGVRYAAPVESGEIANGRGDTRGVGEGEEENAWPSIEQDNMLLTEMSAPAQGLWTTDRQQGMNMNMNADVDKTQGKGKGKAQNHGGGGSMRDDTEKMPQSQAQPQPQSAPAAMQAFGHDIDMGLPAFPAFPGGEATNYGLDDLFLDDVDLSMHGDSYEGFFPEQQQRGRRQ